MSAILLVEDNPITCRLVRFTLEAEHYDVIEAPDGATARKQFREHKPALVLLDLLLPDVDGFALLDELRAQPNGHDVPILAFSGMMSSYDQSRLSEAGFDDVVSKPIEPSRLVQIVRGYVPLGEAPPVETGAAVRTLVLADDDPVQRKLVALRLRRAGFEVVPASTVRTRSSARASSSRTPWSPTCSCRGSTGSACAWPRATIRGSPTRRSS